ncbi:allantoicase [Phyllobacterium brassicacearum]|uniref:Probable allantoicase n=1 Tax=Phyllobacterium brassicacearum TaxID=314235 RepID=A0A2P7BQZ6_9HYPH|nr:allantoicase [Phyllobacterium brassicacearum]PSH68889.1 allantoicase [Phyllobacterium brassicacearum]TDQ33631.1 allantoicase [Phyllobacterium brassicacearum]
MSNLVEELPAFARNSINLASAGLGARPLFATDEFFAPLERMLNDAPAVFYPEKFDDHGKWMDGWETRRRRSNGHDYAIIQFAAPGTIAGFDVDTAHFTGNYPPACRIDACNSTSEPDETTKWTEVLGLSQLGPSAHHFFTCASNDVWTHVRLHIHPDGGVARLRVYGQPSLDTSTINGSAVDLASSLLGGRIVAMSNAHYGHQRLLAPGRGVNMGDGWETRRRREPGNDWIIVKLAARGTIESAIVDTAHFKGNYPDACSIQVADLGDAGESLDELVVASSMFWEEILPQQKLVADTIHEYGQNQIRQNGAVTHARFNIYPDGGVSRVRLFGKIARG